MKENDIRALNLYNGTFYKDRFTDVVKNDMRGTMNRNIYIYIVTGCYY